MSLASFDLEMMISEKQSGPFQGKFLNKEKARSKVQIQLYQTVTTLCVKGLSRNHFCRDNSEVAVLATNARGETVTSFLCNLIYISCKPTL